MKYKVTNKAKDVRKFRDGFRGKDIHVEPNKSVLTKRPPEENKIWKIERISEEKEKTNKVEKNTTIKMEDNNKNDSSSS